MFSGLSLITLLIIFIAAAAAVWFAGIYLSNSTDILSSRFGLGEALGGLIFLAIATNLPEIAIVTSAAWHHNLGIAIGNILGGIAIQTVVLAFLDVFGLGKSGSLMYRAASLVLVIEGVMVIAVLTIAIMGNLLPGSLIFARMTPASLSIAVLWLFGIWMVSKARQSLPWHQSGTPPDGQAEPRGHAEHKKERAAREKGIGTARTIAEFTFGAVVTLAAGVVLERSGSLVAQHVGMTGVIFGATVLAAVTALPELSTGLASIRLGDYQLAVSDIFGGNAFLPVLFLLATLLSGKAVLPQAQKTDIYLTGLGILLTIVYIYGLIFRPRRLLARMGIDSFIVLVLYVIGMVGLIVVARN